MNPKVWEQGDRSKQVWTSVLPCQVVIKSMKENKAEKMKGYKEHCYLCEDDHQGLSAEVIFE
jgi:hypothetical protein